MSYYDYDYEAEPNFPEVEEIINKATDEFANFLRSMFVAEYKNIQVAQENNAIKENRLNERLTAISERERQMQEREAELDKSEKEQYEKLKSKWFSELGLDFDIGNTVYYYKDVTKRITCPTCNGAKKVKAKIESSEFEIDCPTCKGYGGIKGEKEFEIIEATVTQIDAHISKRRTGDIFVEHYSAWSDELITSVWVRDKKGNDSHQIKACNLYKTKEEAGAKIKELLNKKD